jgi:hypothetical protein
MKKIIIITFACVAFIACKKDRECSCKQVYTTATPNSTHDVVTDYSKVYKKTGLINAMNACVHTKEVQTAGTTTMTTDTNCSLK